MEDISGSTELIRTESSAAAMKKAPSLVQTLTPTVTKDTTVKGPTHPATVLPVSCVCVTVATHAHIC